MSDVQQGPGWWLASDGKWYPPESRTQPVLAPPTVQPPTAMSPRPAASSQPAAPTSFTPAAAWPYAAAPAPALRRSVSTGLGGTIQGFSWAVAGLSAIAAVLSIGSLISFDRYWDTPINSRAEDRAFDDWIALDDGFAGAAGLALLCGLVLWILLMIWMNKAHKTTQQLWSGTRQWSSGWTVGGWFIPVANAVIPKLVLGEIEKIAVAPRSGGIVTEGSWKTAPTMWLGKLWWFALIGGAVLNQIGGSLGSDAGSSAGDVRASYSFNAVGFALIAASGVLGALYIRRLGARLSADGLQRSP